MLSVFISFFKVLLCILAVIHFCCVPWGSCFVTILSVPGVSIFSPFKTASSSGISSKWVSRAKETYFLQILGSIQLYSCIVIQIPSGMISVIFYIIYFCLLFIHSQKLKDLFCGSCCCLCNLAKCSFTRFCKKHIYTLAFIFLHLYNFSYFCIFRIVL